MLTPCATTHLLLHIKVSAVHTRSSSAESTCDGEGVSLLLNNTAIWAASASAHTLELRHNTHKLPFDLLPYTLLFLSPSPSPQQQQQPINIKQLSAPASPAELLPADLCAVAHHQIGAVTGEASCTPPVLPVLLERKAWCVAGGRTRHDGQHGELRQLKAVQSLGGGQYRRRSEP